MSHTDVSLVNILLSITRVSLVQNQFIFCQLRVHYIGDPDITKTYLGIQHVNILQYLHELNGNVHYINISNVPTLNCAALNGRDSTVAIAGNSVAVDCSDSTVASAAQFANNGYGRYTCRRFEAAYVLGRSPACLVTASLRAVRSAKRHNRQHKVPLRCRGHRPGDCATRYRRVGIPATAHQV